MFWRRKKGSDFISLGLNTPLETPAESKSAKQEVAADPKPATEIFVQTEISSPVISAPVAENLTPAASSRAVLPAPAPEVLPEAGPHEVPTLPMPVITQVEPPSPAVVSASPAFASESQSDEEEQKGFFTRFRQAITKTRENLSGRIEDIFKGRKQIDAATLDQLEEALIGADIGVQTTMEILEDVRQRVDRQTLKDTDELKRAIREHLIAILDGATKARGVSSETSVSDDVRPYVMMVVGVNGAGKTTTIGKLAQRIKAEGNEVLICAADTFRAAASDQLAIWAERANVPLIQQKQGTDPAAVLFDSLKAASARNADVLIVDTAGRLHNKANLMAELEKMKRVAAREVKGAPHETLLVIDAVTGQNGLSQAREFMKAAPVTGLVITKLDGTAKGGIAVAIARELNLPIRYCGVGEKAEDLMIFNSQAYVDGLFE
jgi:fused signal recognition particle receptor